MNYDIELWPLKGELFFYNFAYYLWLQAGLSRTLGARLRHRGHDGDGRRVVVKGQGQGHRVSYLRAGDLIKYLLISTMSLTSDGKFHKILLITVVQLLKLPRDL